MQRVLRLKPEERVMVLAPIVRGRKGEFKKELQKLAGVGGESFDVAALAFGVNSVEGKRRFARAAEAGDDRQSVAGNLNIDVLEVVLARPPDRDLLYRQWFGSSFAANPHRNIRSECGARVQPYLTGQHQGGSICVTFFTALHCAGAVRVPPTAFA